MIHHNRVTSVAAKRAVSVLEAAAAAGIVALIGVGCTNSAFESQPVDQDSSTSSTEVDAAPVPDGDSEGEELALIADALYEEPDLQADDIEEEISETEAEAPESEPVAADPDDTDDVAQVAVGAGESAICATVQIGRDALLDGAEDLVTTQQELLVSRVDLVEDGELSTLLGSIEDTASADAALFDAALTRCEALGFRP